MATGSISRIDIDVEGYCAYITVDGFTSGSTLNFALQGMNEPTANTPFFTVTSMGFNKTTPTTYTKKIYLTSAIRYAYGASYILGSFTSGTFVADELATQTTTGATATIIGRQDSGTRIILKNIRGSANSSDTWVGGTSGAVFTPTSLSTVYSSGTPHEIVSSTGTTYRCALSDYIYLKDALAYSGADVTFSAPPGFIVNTGGASEQSIGVSFASVNNNSTLNYFRVVGNWSEPGNSKIGVRQKLRCVAYHESAKGNPVECVEFSSTDGTNTATTVVSNATVDKSYGDAVPVVEYIGDLDTSGFIQNNVVTSNFRAYPRIGDDAAVLDTRTSGNISGNNGTAQPTPLYGPILFIADPDGTYCQSIAVVDSTNGNDGTGAVGTDINSPPAAYATIGAAYTALRTYNNTTYSRNNCGGSIIYLKDNAGSANNFAWLGTTPTVGTAPSCWLEITNYPGCDRSNLIISSQSSGRSVGALCKLSNITWTASHASGVYDFASFTTGAVWVDKSVINTSTLISFYRTNLQYFTRNTVTAFVDGFQAFSTSNRSPAIVRGNTITAATRLYSYTILGNVYTPLVTNTFSVFDNVSGSATPTMTNLVIAYNKFHFNPSGAAPVILRAAITDTHGCAIVQNIFENRASYSSPIMQIHADGTINSPVNNIIFWNNVVVGQRDNVIYNEYGAYNNNLVGWFFKNNIEENRCFKGDVFSGNTITNLTRSGTTATLTLNNHAFETGDLITITGASPSQYNVTLAPCTKIDANTLTYVMASDPGSSASPRGALSPNPMRVGNWSFMYGCGLTGNFSNKTITSFGLNFPGLYSYQPAFNAEPHQLVTSNPVTYMKFIRFAAYNGTTAGTGAGDYRLKGGSPARNLQRDVLIPYDIDGNPRGPYDGPGVYSQGTFQSTLLGL